MREANSITVLGTTQTWPPRLISTGTTERGLLAAVARCFPELTPTEFVAAEDATAAAERRAARCH